MILDSEYGVSISVVQTSEISKTEREVSFHSELPVTPDKTISSTCFTALKTSSHTLDKYHFQKAIGLMGA